MVKGAAAIFVHINYQLEKLDTSLSRQELPGVIADRGKLSRANSSNWCSVHKIDRYLLVLATFNVTS